MVATRLYGSPRNRYVPGGPVAARLNESPNSRSILRELTATRPFEASVYRPVCCDARHN
jgi:hypothetical protein